MKQTDSFVQVPKIQVHGEAVLAQTATQPQHPELRATVLWPCIWCGKLLANIIFNTQLWRDSWIFINQSENVYPNRFNDLENQCIDTKIRYPGGI